MPLTPRGRIPAGPRDPHPLGAVTSALALAAAAQAVAVQTAAAQLPPSAAAPAGARRPAAVVRPEAPVGLRAVPPAAAGVVTGRVTAAVGGAPVANVTVAVRGTALGTVTGPDGRYTIGNVPDGPQVVVAQRIGFERDSQTVTVAPGRPAVANFALRAVAVQLSEVVAIGYGTTTRRELTGAVASVGAEQVTAQPVQTVDQALQGRAPGVQVTTQSGQPGAGAAVRIRGGNSVSAGNSPLYVVDGVPILGSAAGANTGTLQTQGQEGLNPLATLNPDDIESIDVLKDASSAAIYGARAANGVILITTKRGRAGRPAVTAGAYYGQQEVRRTLPLLDATQFATLVNEAYTNAGQAAPFTQAEVAGLGRGTDWQDAIFRTSSVRNVDLSASGGGQDTRYYLSGSLLQNDGVVVGTNLDRGTFRLNLDQNFSARVRGGAQVTFSRSQGQVLPNGGAGQEQSSVVLGALLAPPTLPVRLASGEFFNDVNPLTGRPFANPVATALAIVNREEQNRALGNVYGEWDVVPGLTLRGTFGGDYLDAAQDYFSPSTTLPGRNFGGYGSRGTRQTTNWQSETTLNHRRDLRGALGGARLDLLGGLTLQRTNARTISGTSQGFPTDNLGVNGLNTANTFAGVFTGNPNSSLLSYFARANVNVAERYLFTLTGRVDGSSRFGEGNQYAFFPSGAVAWRIAEERPLREAGLFDELKLRLSYGRTGNQEIGNFESLARLGGTVYVFGGGRAVGFGPSSIANPDLKWETTSQFDGGLDVGVFGNRLSLTADYYAKTTRDLLLFVPIPTTSGFSTSLQNVGSVRNRGFELGVNTVNLRGGRLGWTTALNLTWNRNRVLDLGADTIIVNPAGVGAGANQNPTVLKVGHPLGAFYGWTYDGMENGQPAYRDLNGDGEVTEADRTIIGTAQPDFTGGLTNRLTYGPLALSVFLQFSRGNEIYNINRALLTNAAGNANQLAGALGGAAGVPTPRLGNTFDSRPSTLFVEDGSFLRGRNVRLDYTVPPRLLRGAFGRLERLQVYVSAQNFFTRTSYSGYDPEISEYALSNAAQGIDFGTYPQPRQVTVGFTTGF